VRDQGGKEEVDIKHHTRVERIPGGEVRDLIVLDGVIPNKDITHQKMRRVENPKIILRDCRQGHKKGESQTNIKIRKK